MSSCVLLRDETGCPTPAALATRSTGAAPSPFQHPHDLDPAHRPGRLDDQAVRRRHAVRTSLWFARLRHSVDTRGLPARPGQAVRLSVSEQGWRLGVRLSVRVRVRGYPRPHFIAPRHRTLHPHSYLVTLTPPAYSIPSARAIGIGPPLAGRTLPHHQYIRITYTAVRLFRPMLS